ncbi:MAG: hypothetical protein ACOC85_01755 [Thermoplasmatota archaeon]
MKIKILYDNEARKDVSFIVPCNCTNYKDKIKSKYPNKPMDCFAGLELNLGGK